MSMLIKCLLSTTQYNTSPSTFELLIRYRYSSLSNSVQFILFVLVPNVAQQPHPAILERIYKYQMNWTAIRKQQLPLCHLSARIL
jgi:hypothetical protein